MQRHIIRVYGIYIDDADNILLSDEKYGDSYFTKFPGGGLEWGEGTRDCLVREFKEEFNIDIEVLDHFYTTDYFQVSAWDQEHQIMSIYYRIKPLGTIAVPIALNAQSLNAELYKTEALRFVPLAAAQENLQLPIDKVVTRKIMAASATK
jgi:8-oxo-dGTP diphosphatase